MSSNPDVTIIHSSDLHLGVDDSFSQADSLAVLPKVLGAAAKPAQMSSCLPATLSTIIASRLNCSNARCRCSAITKSRLLFFPAITIR